MKPRIQQRTVPVIPDNEEAVIERRQIGQDLRLRFAGHARDIAVHSRAVLTDVEGSKRPLAAFAEAVQQVHVICQQFSDEVDNRDQITRAVLDVKTRTSDLRALDPRLGWTARLVMSACDGALTTLKQPIPTSLPGPTEEPTPNAQRLALANEVEVLLERMEHLGSPLHGGIVQRRPVIAKTAALRATVCRDICSPLDRPAVLDALAEIEADLQELLQLRSASTNSVDFMKQAGEGVKTQIGHLYRLIDGGSVRPQRALIPAVSSRQPVTILTSSEAASRGWGWEEPA